MNKRIATILAVNWMAAAALAVPYWVAYEGNDFPENEGWTRGFSAGGANRYIEDGALVIDSLVSTEISDYYVWPQLANPEPGERFVVEWRSIVNDQPTWFDTAIFVARDGNPGDFRINLGPDRALVHDDWTDVRYAPGQWHEFRIESVDMRSFALFVDQMPALTGRFQEPSILTPFLTFGDGGVGTSSFSRWDYVRFGVVPEPSTSSLVSMLVTCLTWSRK